jgi:hypothetical protein
MANEKQLAILKQGVVVWNAWRKKNLKLRPDLRIAFCMKKDEDHLPGRISISIAWLMAGGPPGTCLRLPVRSRRQVRPRTGRPAA